MRNLDPHSLQPGKGLVLLRALWPEKSKGGIDIPLEFRPRWTPLGEVVSSSGREGLKPGDWVIVEDETHTIPRSSYDVFKIRLRDHVVDEVIIVSLDQEPQFKEIMNYYYAQPSKWRDYYISVVDLSTDQWVHFQPSDVLEFTYDLGWNPTYHLDYIPSVMLSLWTGEKFELFYLIDERRLLATLEFE